MSVSIELEHHRFEIDFSKLLQIDYQGYYTANEAWDELLDLGAAKDNLINQANITLDRNDLIIANYCYPESVFADPVNDFKEYRKWELGVRQFPFSGQYHHLDIRKQDKKKPSEALKGALGEMIGGTLFNNIAHILVRPILRYPDFIGKQPKANAWAYLEAKCFEKPTGTLLFNNRVQQATDSGYKALCLKAASEIRVNKWLTCYASFSEIIHYDPLKIKQTIIEIRDVNRKSAITKPIEIPNGYINEVVNSVKQEVEAELWDNFETFEERLKEGLRTGDSGFEIHRRIRKKIEDIEKNSGMISGEIQNDKICRKKIDIAASKISKAFKDAQKPKNKLKKYKNPTNDKMEEVMQLDDKKKIYAQKMNENIAQTVSNSKGNTSNWKISTYTPRKGTEIYIVGNTFLAISDSKPRIIKSFNPSNWIEKL